MNESYGRIPEIIWILFLAGRINSLSDSDMAIRTVGNNVSSPVRILLSKSA